jgi:hypothetical protein
VSWFSNSGSGPEVPYEPPKDDDKQAKAEPDAASATGEDDQ